MSSAQDLSKFDAEKENTSADIGDVGAAFGPVAVAKGVAQPYKPSHWAQIPDWAKDKEGNWALAYTGTIAFLVDKQQVKDIPHSWTDLKKGKYVVTISDVGVAANGVLAANYTLGGDEKNLKPALAFFADLAKQGRLGVTDPVPVAGKCRHQYAAINRGKENGMKTILVLLDGSRNMQWAICTPNVHRATATITV